MENLRRDNLKKLIREKYKGKQKDFVLDAGVNQGEISSLLNGKRAFGERKARKIEKLASLSDGWLDTDFSVEQNVASAQIGTRKIPLLTYVQAGRMTEVADSNLFDDFILTDLELSDRAFALTIRGDSMHPDFFEGDRVIIDPNVKPRPGDFIVVINDKHHAMFKKYRLKSINDAGIEVFEAVPLNNDYPTLRSDTDNLAIVGTMMEHRRYRKR